MNDFPLCEMDPIEELRPIAGTICSGTTDRVHQSGRIAWLQILSLASYSKAQLKSLRHLILGTRPRDAGSKIRSVEFIEASK
jgi:hypothetical protein